MKKFIFILYILSLLVLARPAFALVTGGGVATPPCGDQNNPAQISCVGIIAGGIIHAALVFIAPVTIILIIIAGYKFIASRGDSKQLEGARKTITFALIGLAVVAFSYFILSIIAGITGVSCITDIFHNGNAFDFSSCGM